MGLPVLLALCSPAVAGADDFKDGFESLDGVWGPCDFFAIDPLVQPEGRVGRMAAWNHAFYAAPFYTTTTYLHPIGSVTMLDAPQAGSWLSIPFVPVENAQYQIVWDEAQSVLNPDAGIVYNGRPARSAYLTVSPCPGDFRLEDNAASDGFLKRGCRRAGNTDTIRFRTDIVSSTTSNCALRPGTQYFLNIGFFEPGETDPQAHTCRVGNQCEINVLPQ